MLFDEPTSALDPEMMNQVLEVMVHLAKQGMTMVVVTHEMGFARQPANASSSWPGGHRRGGDPRGVLHQPQRDRAKEFLTKILNH